MRTQDKSAADIIAICHNAKLHVLKDNLRTEGGTIEGHMIASLPYHYFWEDFRKRTI
jgi:hypothetical protein